MTAPTDPVTRARQLLDAATPGPWEMSEVEATAPHWLTDVFVTDADLGEPVAQILVLDHPDYEVWQPRADANAELIAAAPTLIADLLAERDRLADDLRKLSTRTTGDGPTDLRMLYAYEAGVMETEARLADENRALRAAILDAATELGLAHEPDWASDKAKADGKDPVWCRVCGPADGSWPCTSQMVVDDLLAAADRGDTDGDRNEGDER